MMRRPEPVAATIVGLRTPGPVNLVLEVKDKGLAPYGRDTRYGLPAERSSLDGLVVGQPASIARLHDKNGHPTSPTFAFAAERLLWAAPTTPLPFLARTGYDARRGLRACTYLVRVSSFDAAAELASAGDPSRPGVAFDWADVIEEREPRNRDPALWSWYPGNGAPMDLRGRSG